MQQYFKSFAIVLDEGKKEEHVSCFKRLYRSVFGSKKKPTTIAMENIKKMFKTIKTESTVGDRFFVKDNSFEFELLRRTKCRNKFCANTTEYNLMRDFERLVELLTSFVEEPKCKCKPAYEVEVTIELPRPKKLRKVTTYDKITILERWVKIGYEMYRRQFDVFSGDEYIVVDGDVYYIKCNRHGQEYLA
jgi:hypothetical protein